MKTFRSRAAASLAVLGALSMTATPVLAHGPDEWHRHDHRDGVDGGTLLAGLLVVGGIAAIASAASKSTSDQARIEPAGYSGTPDNATPGDRAYGEGVPPDDSSASAPDNAQPDDRAYRDDVSPDGTSADAPENVAPDDRGNSSDEALGSSRVGDSFDAAVDACGSEIEHGDHRIGSVDSVRRTDNLYNVEGRLQDGRGFACSIGDDGQIRSIDIDGHALT